jgi:hypothetical protein
MPLPINATRYNLSWRGGDDWGDYIVAPFFDGVVNKKDG